MCFFIAVFSIVSGGLFIRVEQVQEDYTTQNQELNAEREELEKDILDIVGRIDRRLLKDGCLLINKK